MTVVLALSCRDGIVLASDSQETSGATRTVQRKIWDVDGRVAWGAAGETALTERLVVNSYALRVVLAEQRFQIADGILGVTTPLQRTGLDGHVALPNTQPAMLAALFCWCEGDFRHIYQVTPTGAGSCFRPYRAAIGSGGPFADVALSSVAHLQTHELDLERLKMVAFKAVQDVILTSSFGVAFPIQMCTVTPNEGVRHLTMEELNPIRDSVGLWMEEQRRILRELGEDPARVAAAEEAAVDEAVAEAEAADDPGLEPAE